MKQIHLSEQRRPEAVFEQTTNKAAFENAIIQSINTKILSRSDHLSDPRLRRLSHLFSCQMLNPHFHQRSEPCLPSGSLFIILDALSGEKDAGNDGLAFRFPAIVSVVPFLVWFARGRIVTTEQLSSANEYAVHTSGDRRAHSTHLYHIVTNLTTSLGFCDVVSLCNLEEHAG